MADIEEMWGDHSRPSSIIKVVGVGGGGCNAVNYMYELGIKDVDFVVCNTDVQALSNSPVPVKIQLGKKITEGLGAGSDPEQGRIAAEESLSEVAELIRSNTKMVFITAGMGGGTGTGAAPVIAKVAKDMGILTVAIVTLPFSSLEPWRMETAYSGIRELRKYVDSLLVINNEKLLELYGDLTLFEALDKADEVLCTAAKSIAEIITVSGHINVDFADVRSAMKNSGVALIGIGRCSGENRAVESVNQAINSPLLNNNSIRGAKNVLINIMMGTKELKMSEMKEINAIVLSEVGDDRLYIKTGVGKNPQLGEDVTVSIIATGFEMDDIDIPDGPGEKPFTKRSAAPPRPPKPPKPTADVPIIDCPPNNYPPLRPYGEDEEVGQQKSAQEGSRHLSTHGGGGHATPTSPAMPGQRVPVLLDKAKTSEELERPIRATRRAKSSHSGDEVSLFAFDSASNRWENTSASYIDGKPD
ncbi:MAG: cell division protein FtsZ [Prevotellaceae bacterium]|jgi:cell division protein FtsZ|nr:cell division protein FtsZ [Prevotellaceae bacterium]